MNVLIRHNGTNISDSVIRYERVHKICTGIGNLTIEIEGTIGRTFEPWDTVDIHENGDFKVRYYVSSIVTSEPKGTITLDCQDISKRLVDYFIPESYIIETPSYTRTWIEQFLTEAGVDYTFNTSSMGQLMSNFTQLGLVPAYEQILTLLQMSGWFIYFDGNERAVIGPLDADLASNVRSADFDDILDINRVSDDKMLRNRALILGAFDPFTLAYASADVTVHTRWNYDRRDVRAVVISNSNIPNKSSAYGMANQLIKEFARITVEKHIRIHGAKDWNLGDALRVKSNVWKGKGLITTFGTAMSKDGLVTNVILDERCPRLFGFFNFGDYVYVGTFGDGIWRKHIRFIHTWEDFSTGLDELRITDLHINNGVFGSVGASGQMYYAYGEDDSWHGITVTGLMSSDESTTASGLVNYSGFTGIMGRATIVDKTTNNVKFGVDTWSGLNMGDYFLSISGWSGVTAFSGIVPGFVLSGGGGDHRGWILEYNPLTGQLTGGLGSGIYPVHWSGNYNVRIVDLENDGFNDYVSIRTPNNSVIPMEGTYEWEYGETSRNYKGGALVSWSLMGLGEELVDQTSVSSVTMQYWGVIDKSNYHRIAYIFKSGSSWIFTSRPFHYQSDGPHLDSAKSVVLSEDFAPIATLATGGIRYAGQGKFRFLGRMNNILTVMEATESGSTLTVSSVLSLGNTWAYQDMEGEQAVFLKPVTEDGLQEAVVVNYVSGTSATFTVFDFPDLAFALGDIPAMELRCVLVNGQVHSIGAVAEDREEGGFKYYLVNGINQAGVGDLIHEGFGEIQVDSFAKRTSTQASGNVIITDVGAWFCIPGAGSIMDTITPEGTYVDDSPYTFKVVGNTLKKASLSLSALSWTDLEFEDYDDITTPLKAKDSITGQMYVLAYKGGENNTYLVALDSNAGAIQSELRLYPGDPDGGAFYNVGNVIIETTDSATALSQADVIFRIFGNNNAPTGSDGGGYMVLQRDGLEYNIIQREDYPIRLDISNSSPIFVTGSGDLNFKSHYVHPDNFETIFTAVATEVRQVNDYRYVMLEPVSSGVIVSGVALGEMGLYVFESGVFGQDIATYSGGWQPIYSIPSGHGTRIETSNYGMGGQYIFITTSGDTQMFWQMDPGQVIFTAYSGLPQSRATIIRLDDRI